MDESNILTIYNKDNQELNVEVLDIFYSEEFKKEYIIYMVVGDEQSVYASILIENNNSYNFVSIEDDKEYEYVNKKIDELVLEGSEE